MGDGRCRGWTKNCMINEKNRIAKKEQQRKEIFSTYSELCPQKPQDNRLSGLETGNKKTGKSGRIYDKILVWNIPPRITCPGVSDWCSTHCYNADARKDVYTIDRWCENLWDFHFRLPELKDKIENQINETTGRCAVRLHSSGDFFSEEYIDFWKEIIWLSPKMLEIRAFPRVQSLNLLLIYYF